MLISREFDRLPQNHMADSYLYEYLVKSEPNVHFPIYGQLRKLIIH